MRVCIVCAGNICRSPMAEAVFRSRLDDAGLKSVSVESAGTGDWHEGEPADPRASRTLRANGYDAAGHRARQFRASWFDDVDLVLALDRANYANLRSIAPDDDAAAKIIMLRSFDPDSGDDLDVPDPYYGGDTGFDHVLDLVERAAAGFVDHVRTTHGDSASGAHRHANPSSTE